MPLLEIVFSSLVTLLAAFLGASYAFERSERAKRRQTTRDHVAAANRALLVLIRQFNSLKFIQTQFINPARQDPGRFMAMRPVLKVREDSQTVDLDSLSFLLATDDHDLLTEVLSAQEVFHRALHAVYERSRLYIEVLQPKLLAAGLKERAEYFPSQIVAAVGEPLILHMELATDDAVEQVDTAVETFFRLIASFRGSMRQRFPEHTIISLGSRSGTQSDIAAATTRKELGRPPH